MRRVGILVDILTTRYLNPAEYPYDKTELSFFGQAASYHDIGKAWMPRSILIKPGELTEEEREHIRKHPLYGREWFLKKRKSKPREMTDTLLRLSGEAASYHQEWWNGSGYPYGISRDSIPLVARVTAVCDAYEAMTGDRVYQSGFAHSSACRELAANAGKQFDPTLVRVFLEHEKEIFEHYTSRCMELTDLPPIPTPASGPVAGPHLIL